MAAKTQLTTVQDRTTSAVHRRTFFTRDLETFPSDVCGDILGQNMMFPNTNPNQVVLCPTLAQRHHRVQFEKNDHKDTSSCKIKTG